MSLETTIWLFTIAVVLAQIEKYVMYQRGWSGSYGVRVNPRQLLVVSLFIVGWAAYTAMKASTSPDIAFGFAVTMPIACAAFQFIPWIRRGEWRYVPGLVSELLLLCPLAIIAGWRALAGGHLSARSVLLVVAPLIVLPLLGWLIASKSPMRTMPPGPLGS